MHVVEKNRYLGVAIRLEAKQAPDLALHRGMENPSSHDIARIRINVFQDSQTMTRNHLPITGDVDVASAIQCYRENGVSLPWRPRSTSSARKSPLAQT